MGGSSAEGHRNHGLDVIHGNLGELAGIRCGPQEQCVNATDTKLQGGDGHGETGSTAGSLEGELVGNVVIVVAKVPVGKASAVTLEKKQSKKMSRAVSQHLSVEPRSVCGKYGIARRDKYHSAK